MSGVIIERVSVASDGIQANGQSDSSSLSAGGRYVAFISFASNLVESDTNGWPDVFVLDRVSGVTERVSVASDGVQANGPSLGAASMSADGRYVAFLSVASNLVPGNAVFSADIFVHDRVSGVTERVSVARDGAQPNDSSMAPSISADGRYVAFSSWASNLVEGDTNNASDIFVHDRVSGVTERVSVASSRAQANGESAAPSISADGRFVAFMSWASNLEAGDTNGMPDIFVHDRVGRVTERVSVASDGTQTDAKSWAPSISDDGRYVAFLSTVSNRSAGDTNDASDVFVHDRVSGVTERVSVPGDGAEADGRSSGVSISADGRFVTFSSAASNLVRGDTNDLEDVFVVTNPLFDQSTVPPVDGWLIKAVPGDTGVLFTVTRPDVEDTQTVYLSTVQDSGASNDGLYFGILNQPVVFAAGVATRNFTVTWREDRRNAEPAEFGVILQLSPDDPIDTRLVRAGFTVPAGTVLPSDPIDPGDAAPVEPLPEDDPPAQGGNPYGGFAVVAADDAGVYLSTQDGALYRWNMATGETVRVASTGLSLTDIAIAPDGRLFGITATALHRIDPQTGASALVGPMTGPLFFGVDALTQASGFDISPLGVGRVSSANNTVIATVDLETGRVSNDQGPLLGVRQSSPGDLWFTGDRTFSVSTTGSTIINAVITDRGGEIAGSSDFVSGARMHGLVGAPPGAVGVSEGELIGFSGTAAYRPLQPLGGVVAFAELPVAAPITGAALRRGATLDVAEPVSPILEPPDRFFLEFAARNIAYDGMLREGDLIPTPEGYRVDAVWENGGFRAVGLRSDAHAPVIAIRGTENFFGGDDWAANSDRRGVGFTQFETQWQTGAIQQWLTDRDGIDGAPVHIVGHSQGGAQAQLLAGFAAASGLAIAGVATFNAPGVSPAAIDTFGRVDPARVTHFVSSGDLVSQAGLRFLDGAVEYYNFDARTVLGIIHPAYPLAVHTGHWSQTEISDTPQLAAVFSTGATAFSPVENYRMHATEFSISDLANPDFSHLYSGDTVDAQFFQFLTAVTLVLTPVAGLKMAADVSSNLVTRAGTEALRTGVGVATEVAEGFRELWSIWRDFTLGLRDFTTEQIDRIATAGRIAASWTIEAARTVRDWGVDGWTWYAQQTNDTLTSMVNWGVRGWLNYADFVNSSLSGAAGAIGSGATSFWNWLTGSSPEVVVAESGGAVTHTESTPAFLVASDAGNTLTSGAANSQFLGGLGTDVYQLTGGDNLIWGVPAQLDGDTARGFGASDGLLVSGVSATIVVQAENSVRLLIDTTGDGEGDITFRFEGDYAPGGFVATPVSDGTLITYSKTNLPLRLADVQFAMNPAGFPLSGSVLAASDGAADPESGPLTVVAVDGVELVPGAAITLGSGARLTMADDGMFLFAPLRGAAGGDAFTVTLRDGTGREGSATAQIAFLEPTVVSGTTDDDALTGTAGDDVFLSSTGRDTLDGGAGFDTVDYAASPSGVLVNLASGTGRRGHAAGDRYVSIERVIGSDHADVLWGNDQSNVLEGGAGDDFLRAGGGDNFLFGGPGDDMLIAGPGSNLFDGGSGVDTVRYHRSTAGVTVDLGAGTGSGGWAEGDRLVSVENLVGSVHDDVLIGDGEQNILQGLAGDDVLVAVAGDNFLFGGAGNDRLVAGTGNDRMRGGADADTFVFGPDHGFNTIRDFQRRLDRIEIVGEDRPASFDDLTITSVRFGTRIDHADTRILLENVFRTDLVTESLFDFV